VLGLGAVLGFNGWQTYQARKSEAASVLYQRGTESYQQGDTEGAREYGDQLLQEYAATAYAAPAALLLARVEVEAGDYPSARARLQWVLDNADDTAVVHTARLRLATVLLAEGSAQEALTRLGGIEPGAYASQYDELRGDAHRASGDRAAARDAYQAALSRLMAGSPYREVLQRKLDDTAGATQGG
jgi:predicted negative regulator of RcsB-dependent stress response